MTVTGCSPHNSNPEVGNIVVKATVFRINLIIDGAPISSRARTHHSHYQTSRLLTSSLCRCPRPPHNPVYPRSLDPSVLVFSLSLHRHPCICVLFSSRFICFNYIQQRTSTQDWCVYDNRDSDSVSVISPFLRFSLTFPHRCIVITTLPYAYLLEIDVSKCVTMTSE